DQHIGDQLLDPAAFGGGFDIEGIEQCTLINILALCDRERGNPARGWRGNRNQSGAWKNRALHIDAPGVTAETDQRCGAAARTIEAPVVNAAGKPRASVGRPSQASSRV